MSKRALRNSQELSIVEEDAPKLDFFNLQLRAFLASRGVSGDGLIVAGRVLLLQRGWS